MVGEGVVPLERGAELPLVLLAMLLAVTELVVERAIMDMGRLRAGLPWCRGGSYSVCVCPCSSMMYSIHLQPVRIQCTYNACMYTCTDTLSLRS